MTYVFGYLFYLVMFQKYFKIVVLLIIIYFTFLAHLKNKNLSDASKGLSDFGTLQTSVDVKTTKLTTS